ncbi:MAG: hypothetical protein WDN46_23105 [Methylocella sp.]
MTQTVNQYARWQAALAGKPMEWSRGDVPSGFFRQGTSKGQEAIAIWRDETGKIQCKRSIFGDGSKLTSEDEIGEELSGCFVYPIPYELYTAVTRDKAEWPPEYKTRLTMKEQQAGLIWTLELGRKKLGADIEPEAAENPRAVAGSNSEGVVEVLAPEKDLQDRIDKVSTRAKDFLKSIKNSPTTKEEADKLADFATKMSEFKTTAEDKHKVEKEPHLKAGRAVDAKWFGMRNAAEALRAGYLVILNGWLTAEKTRLAAEAAAATAERQRLADIEAAATNEAPVTVTAVVAEPVRAGNLRTVSQRKRRTWRCKDRNELALYLIKIENEEIYALLERLAQKLGAAGVKHASIEEEGVVSAS